jgi:hypothetical protein
MAVLVIRKWVERRVLTRFLDWLTPGSTTDALRACAEMYLCRPDSSWERGSDRLNSLERREW